MPTVLTRSCAECGLMFTRTGKAAKGRFCSPLCRHRFLARDKPHVTYTKTCEACDGLFETPNKWTRYCSTECVVTGKYGSRTPGRSQRSCEWCGQSFTPHSGNNVQRCCSREHGQALRAEREGRLLACKVRQSKPEHVPKFDPVSYHQDGRPRRGVPRVAFCWHGCGRADIIPARQGKWSCDDCKELHSRVSRALRGWGNGISWAKRHAVFERDNWTCQLCGNAITSRKYSAHDVMSPTVDHIIPVSLGGSDNLDNLRAAHMWCNSKRGAGFPSSGMIENTLKQAS